jgi:putative endonuclease
VLRNLLFCCTESRFLVAALLRMTSAVMRREKRYYVYILASKSRVLYIGVTGFLLQRVLQHKAGDDGGFTTRYHVNRLVYLETFQYVDNAIARETELKKWRREKKVRLIEANNPTWEDLAAEWGKPSKLVIPNAL